MNIGTKSLLYGVHQFAIHPWVLAYSWYKLYGWGGNPNLRNWRLWIAFIVHDWGYWGKPNMDGPEGETHVELGAKIMSLFDKKPKGKWIVDRGDINIGSPRRVQMASGYKIRWSELGVDNQPEWSAWVAQERYEAQVIADEFNQKGLLPTRLMTWEKFCLYHSRFYAKQYNHPPSRLCYADKVAIYTLPKWVYLILVRLTGEYKEYMIKVGDKYHGEGRNPTNDINQWYDEMVAFLKTWVIDNCRSNHGC